MSYPALWTCACGVENLWANDVCVSPTCTEVEGVPYWVCACGTRNSENATICRDHKGTGFAEVVSRSYESPVTNAIGSIVVPNIAAERKALPITTGVLDYFPDALLAVSSCSKKGNDQHNKGQPLHWAREKSTDHADCLVRHLLDRGTLDTDGIRHSAKVAWRALALLQLEIEGEKK